MTGRNGDITAAIISDSENPAVSAASTVFQKSLKTITGLEIPVKAKRGGYHSMRFHLGLDFDSPSTAALLKSFPHYKDAISKDGYIIQYYRGGIYLLAVSEKGLANAIRRFLIEYCKAELETPENGNEPVIKSHPENYGINLPYVTLADDETVSNLRKITKCDSSYTVKKTATAIPVDNKEKFFASKEWESANTLRTTFDVNPKENALPQNEFFRPDVNLKMLYDSNYLYLLYEVKDRYVKTTVSGRQGNV